MLILRDYQLEDVEKLAALDSAACFNDMRTGKTVVALHWALRKALHKILIVCPISAIPEWEREIELWTSYDMSVCTGTPKQRFNAIKEFKTGIMLTNYEALKIEKLGLDKLKFDGIILDEAHRIRNRKTLTAKAVKSLKVKNKLALTGTPGYGAPQDIFGILHWLLPKEYPSYWKFIMKYFKTESVNMPGRCYTNIIGFKDGAEQELLTQLNKIATQRKRKDVMAWLPDKVYHPIYLAPTKKQLKYLTDLANMFETEHVVTQGVLDRLIRYRQICVDPTVLNLPSVSPKTNWLIDYIKDYPDKSILVFSKQTKYIRLLEKKLAQFSPRVIVGATPKAIRGDIVRSFQAGDIKILLMNIDACKEALTLDKADTLIFTDVYPPAGSIAQAEDRFVATTEAKSNKPHDVYRLILKGTYDEELYNLIDKRSSESDVINNFSKYIKEVISE